MVAGVPHIVGRSTERAFVAAFVGARGPGVLEIVCDAGSGKSTLFESALAAEGPRFLIARPSGAEATLSLSTVGDLLSGLSARRLQRLPAPQRRLLGALLLLDEPSEPAPEPRALAVACLTALRQLADERPVVVAIDDFHWADPASASILAFVARRLPDASVRFLLTLRADQGARAFAPMVVDRVRAERLELAPLAQADVAEILDAQPGPPMTRSLVRRICERAAGNPFFALELARGLRACGSIPAAGDIRLPRSVRELLDRRLAALPARARRALLAVALLADRRTDVLATCGELTALEPAVAADVVRVEDGYVRFAHPLLAEAARAAASRTAQRQMHARLADVVGDGEARARHLALASVGRDRSIARVLDDVAARARRRGDLYAAAELGELALGMTPLGDSALAERQLRAGQAWRVTGQAARAGELAGAANDATADGPLRAAALRLLAAVAPDEPGALALCDRALYEARADPRLLVEVRGERANRLMALGRQDDAVAEARETVAAAEALGDRELLAAALAQFAWQSRLAGRPRRAELDRAVAMAPGSHVGWFGYSPTVCRAVCLVWDDSLDEARAILERVAHGARERGDEITLATALRHLAELECRAGRFVASETLALECLGLVAPETSALEDSAHHYLLASALAHRGCVDEARSHAREGARRSQKAGEQIYRVLHESIQGFLALSLGDAVAADRHLRPLWPTVTAMGFGEPSVWPVLPTAIEALIALGESDRAAVLLDDLERRGHALDSPWALSQAARCRGLMSTARGDPAQALSHFDSALREHARMPGAFERARTMVGQGVALRRLKRRRDARQTLTAARGIFEELGSPLWADRARGELSRIGGRAPSNGTLTATEQRVAALVAEGRSNKAAAAELCVSVRAVEANLTRIYAKLGLRSRAELARRLARHP